MVQSTTILSFEEWKQQHPDLVTSLGEQELLQKYNEYKASVSGGTSGTQTLPIFQDTSKEKDNTSKTETSKSNIDLVGFGQNLQQFGLMTSNPTMAKIGALGNTTFQTFQGIKDLKNLKASGATQMAAGIGSIAGGAADALDKTFFAGQRAKNSSLTNTLDDTYDSASSAVMSMGPYGAIIGGAMKAGGLVSDGLSALGVGTDQMTTADKVFDSKFLKLTPMGLINAIGAKTSDKFQVDNHVREQIGGSYGGAYTYMDDAASRANKKYGLFSRGALREANERIRNSKVMQAKISDINTEAQDMRSIATSSADLLSTGYATNLSGGYDQKYLRAAKDGAKLQRIKKINLSFRSGGKVNNVINVETKEIEWQPIITFDDDIPEYKEGGPIWRYGDESTIETFKEGGTIEEWKPVIIFEEGGKTEETSESSETSQKNVIPEGALHARKHHMENTEGLTQKGIPVIDNEGEQQAEIELNEIIFNLEVTKKLEELCEDGSDEAAIEAGKLLVQEILHNTEDRTGLIDTLKQGGKINGEVV